MGGLGNQLFQIAFADLLSKRANVKLHIDQNLSFKHSSQQYLETVCKHWQSLQTTRPAGHVIEEVLMRPQNWLHDISRYPDIFLVGYFQNFQYVTHEFISKLHFSTSVLERFPDIQNTVFLHIRGGDYVDHPMHDVKLDSYYQKAIKLFPKGTKFSVFTNDKEYGLTRPYLKDIEYSFVDSDNEVDDLYLMTQCKGGICANSTFSWWGAFINPNRQLILPSKWWNDENWYSKGLYFNGCTIVEV